MANDRVQRRIDRLLDQVEEAIDQLDWEEVRQRAQAVLRLDPENSDAIAYLAAAERDTEDSRSTQASPFSLPVSAPVSDHPTSFANRRYQVNITHPQLIIQNLAYTKSADMRIEC